MLDRETKANIFNAINTGDIVINTHPDGSSGNNVNVPVEVVWGQEPNTIDTPTIILNDKIKNQPNNKTVGNLYGETDDGQLYGREVSNTLSITIASVDYKDDDGNFIDMDDIANELMSKRIINPAREQSWDSLITDGVVADENDYVVDDVSAVFELKTLKKLQIHIKINTFLGGIPTEGEIKYATAPTIEYVDTEMEKSE